MPDILKRIARRAVDALPRSAQERVREKWARRSYSLNTAGAEPNPGMRSWFDAHGRPVSIVIPSYNDLPLLREALRSIEETCAHVEYEVIIVDDFIDAEVSAQLMTLESDTVRVVLKDRRRGFAGTVNVGMELARHDIVLLNSDIVAQPGWLEALQYSAYEIDPHIGMVSPKLVYPTGRIQYAGTYYARLLAPQWFGHLHVGAPAMKPTANVPGYNRSISGACVYITRDAYERVGLLDDEYWLGFEDVDLGLRAWALGVRCYYQPAAMLIHHESASRGYSQGPRELASMRRFWRRWQADFLAREMSDEAPVTFLVGDATEPMWRRYVDGLAEHIRAEGRQSRVIDVSEDPDEDLLRDLAATPGVVVVCDWRAATTGWLAGTAGSLPIYLLPSIESIAYPHDPARQASIIAGYRPEFDYVAPNRWTAAQLQAEAAWEVRRRIAPAVAPADLADASDDLIVTLGADPATRAAVDAIGRATHLPAGAHIDDVRALRPRAVVDLRAHSSSLEPFAGMSIGAAYLAPQDARLSHEVLDGYNALTHRPGDLAQLASSLRDVMADDDIWRELRANGHDSAARAARAAQHGFVEAVRSYSTSPV